MSEKNPHALRGGWPGALSVGSGVLQPSIVINGGNSEPLVTITGDGEVKIANPEKIDDAARAFFEAVQHLLHKAGPFVVRKRGVSEFMTICMGAVDWTQNDKLATHFARQADAHEAAIGQDVEILPVSKAMVF